MIDMSHLHPIIYTCLTKNKLFKKN